MGSVSARKVKRNVPRLDNADTRIFILKTNIRFVDLRKALIKKAEVAEQTPNSQPQMWDHYQDYGTALQNHPRDEVETNKLPIAEDLLLWGARGRGLSACNNLHFSGSSSIILSPNRPDWAS